MPLGAQEAEAIEAVGREVDTSRTAVGEAYLRFEESRQRFERDQERLEQAAARARTAEAHHRSTMNAIAKALDLAPGEWVYDKARTRLVRKGASDV